MTTSTAHSWKSPSIGIVQQEIGIFLYITISNHCHPVDKELLILQIEVKANFTGDWHLQNVKKNSKIYVNVNRSKLFVGKPSQFRNPKRLRLPKKNQISFWIGLGEFLTLLLVGGNHPRNETSPYPTWIEGCVDFLKSDKRENLFVCFEEGIWANPEFGPFWQIKNHPLKKIGPSPTHSHFKTHLNLMNNFHVNHRQFFSRCKNNINLSRCTSLNGSKGWPPIFGNVVFFMFFFEIIRLNLGHFALIEFGHWGTFCVGYFVLVFRLHFYKSFGGNLDSFGYKVLWEPTIFPKKTWSCWMVEKSFETGWIFEVSRLLRGRIVGWLNQAATSGRFPWS